jgi:hypothetical protein
VSEGQKRLISTRGREGRRSGSKKDHGKKESGEKQSVSINGEIPLGLKKKYRKEKIFPI